MREIPLLRKWSSQEGLCSAGLVNDINTSNFNMLTYLHTYSVELSPPWEANRFDIDIIDIVIDSDIFVNCNWVDT